MTKLHPTTDSKAILVDLMEVDDARNSGYLSPADLSALLRHQLRTSLLLEAEDLQSWASPGADVAALVNAGPHATFDDVLRKADAGDPLLRLVKEHAKGGLTDGVGLPEPVARFFYISSILRAKSVGDSTVSRMDAASIDAEARRLLAEHWLPDEAREILRAGLDG